VLKEGKGPVLEERKWEGLEEGLPGRGI